MLKNRKRRFFLPRSRRAFNLVEMIITSLLVGVIAIGIVPLFTRAVVNNVYGADASQVASFLRSGAERVQQRSANSAVFDTEGSTVTYFDTGVRDTVTQTDAVLGDEQWVPEDDGDGGDTEAKGIFLWTQTRTVVGYSVADVFKGNIKVGGGSGSSLDPLGHPKLFDNPGEFYAKPDITEFRSVIESMRGGQGKKVASTAAGIKQKATVGHFRAF